MMDRSLMKFEQEVENELQGWRNIGIVVELKQKVEKLLDTTELGIKVKKGTNFVLMHVTV